MEHEKEIRWVGSAYEDLLDFPDDARRQVYVLHCFQKKTQATSRRDKGIAETRYRAVVNTRKVRK